MLELLEQLFRQVRAYALSERFNRNQVYLHSPDHTTMQFDRDAEDIIIQGLTDSGHGFEVFTEERPTFATNSSPAYRIVIDPVDGSRNVARGIMTAGVALAVLPSDVPILPENVQWALVGNLFNGTVYQAQRGGGAFRNGRRCQVSGTKHIKDCLAGMNFDGHDKASIRALLTQEPTLGGIRRCGSAAVDTVYVASGAYDAYIDIGNILTGESFLASLSIILEAGGTVSDPTGQPLQPIINLKQGFSLVVASTKELHKEIITRLN
ncbi:MAG TPA: inositol monophosphatase family protein [Ktedonobacteraceae bacterium]|jgi:myo-inositol-1(or 4)-monophosphatase|nr:inositol monophosphatase family protein [Ktedonobacteraceae bacterium]